MVPLLICLVSMDSLQWAGVHCGGFAVWEVLNIKQLSLTLNKIETNFFRETGIHPLDCWKVLDE